MKEELEKARAVEDVLRKDVQLSSSQLSELSAAELERVKEDMESTGTLLADKQEQIAKLEEEVSLDPPHTATAV